MKDCSTSFLFIANKCAGKQKVLSGNEENDREKGEQEQGKRGKKQQNMIRFGNTREKMKASAWQYLFQGLLYDYCIFTALENTSSLVHCISAITIQP